MSGTGITLTLEQQVELANFKRELDRFAEIKTYQLGPNNYLNVSEELKERLNLSELPERIYRSALDEAIRKLLASNEVEKAYALKRTFYTKIDQTNEIIEGKLRKVGHIQHGEIPGTNKSGYFISVILQDDEGRVYPILFCQSDMGGSKDRKEAMEPLRTFLDENSRDSFDKEHNRNIKVTAYRSGNYYIVNPTQIKIEMEEKK